MGRRQQTCEQRLEARYRLRVTLVLVVVKHHQRVDIEAPLQILHRGADHRIFIGKAERAGPLFLAAIVDQFIVALVILEVVDQPLYRQCLCGDRILLTVIPVEQVGGARLHAMLSIDHLDGQGKRQGKDQQHDNKGGAVLLPHGWMTRCFHCHGFATTR